MISATALDEVDERFQGRADPMLLAVCRYHHAERCHGPRPPWFLTEQTRVLQTV